MRFQDWVRKQPEVNAVDLTAAPFRNPLGDDWRGAFLYIFAPADQPDYPTIPKLVEQIEKDLKVKVSLSLDPRVASLDSRQAMIATFDTPTGGRVSVLLAKVLAEMSEPTGTLDKDYNTLLIGVNEPGKLEWNGKPMPNSGTGIPDFTEGYGVLPLKWVPLAKPVVEGAKPRPEPPAGFKYVVTGGMMGDYTLVPDSPQESGKGFTDERFGMIYGLLSNIATAVNKK